MLEKTFEASILTGYDQSYECNSIDNVLELVEVLIHFSAAITETVNVTLNSRNGSNYDVLVKSESLVSSQDFRYAPDGANGLMLLKGDALDLAVTSGTTATAYATLRFKEM